MRKRFLTGLGMVALLAGPAMAEYQLTILHTNDFHARFEPISKYDSGCSDEDNADGKCFGGTARLITAVADARARATNSILVDGGDQFQGTLFYTYYKGQMAAEMMNRLGYDAMTVGNHEFDDGPEVLRGFMDAVDFPVLMSNADVSREPQLRDVIRKSVVITRGGERLGLVGLTPEDNHDLSSPGGHITFSDPVKAVQAEVKRLTRLGINKIIVLSHSGYHLDLRIARETTGVDVIVGGHTNTLLSNTRDRAAGPYPTMVGNTAIVQAYAYGKFLGELNVTFDDDGVITHVAGEPLIMDAGVVEDQATVQRIDVLAQPLDVVRQRVVARAATAIEGEREVCRVSECSMGNLVADAMLAQVRDQGIEIAIMNAGGLRASIDAGEVTMGEILTVLPFQNTLSTFEITGQTLIDALENGVSRVEDVNGRFPQVAGLRFHWDPSIPPNEGRVTRVEVRHGGTWEPVDRNHTYGVVSNNFVRGGGDGYKMFRTAANVYDYGPDLADVTVAYMASHGNYAPYVDGRIVRK